MTIPFASTLFGPMLIGTYLNAILYGVMIIQAFVYYQIYTTDKTWLRYFILYLVICNTLNTVFDILMVYEPLILKYGTIEAVTRAPLFLSADAVMTVLISTPVQLFLGWRIKILSGSLLLTLFIIFLSFCSFAGGVATTIGTILIPDYASEHELNPAVLVWLAPSAMADVVITASLVWTLRSRKSGIQETDTVINKIIQMAIQTGAVTALFALLAVFMLLTGKNATLQFVWDLPLGKLYTVSLLSNMNARAAWWNSMGKQRAVTIPNTLFKFSEEFEKSNERASVALNRNSMLRFTNTEIQFCHQRDTFSILTLPTDSQTGNDIEAGRAPIDWGVAAVDEKPKQKDDTPAPPNRKTLNRVMPGPVPWD